MSPLESALEQLTIPELWHRLKLAGTPKRSCRSPFRDDDRNPSFSIYDSGRRWKDHGTGETGDQADFVAKACGLSAEGGARKLIEIAGLKRPAADNDTFKDTNKARCRASWPAFDVPTQAEIAAIAEVRGLSPEGVSLAANVRLLFCCASSEGRAWVVTDSRRINAQARRLNGKGWIAKGGAKSWTLTLPGSIASWPMGLSEAQAFPAIALVEGGPDLLAAFHLALCATSAPETLALCKGADVIDNLGVVAMFGAQNHIPENALPLFAGKRCRIFAHDDVAGYQAAARWANTLGTTSAVVDGFSFRGFRQSGGRPVNDLNDFVSLDPDPMGSRTRAR